MSSFNVGRLSAAVFVALYIGTTHASGVEPRISDKSEHPRFNEAFLRGDGIDLAQFLAQGAITPGQYRVELYLNTQLVSMESINFKSLDNDVKPCLSSELLARIGVRQAAIDQGLFKNGPYSATCLDIDNIEYASWDYDTGAQKLFLSFPQAQLERDIRGYVSPALWEEGEAVGFVNYNIQSRFDHSTISGDSHSHYLGFNSGINIGPWRLRNQSNLSAANDQGHWQSQRTYVERDLTAWRSQFSAGQIYSRSEVFDTPSLLGLQVRSDDSMLPDELRGYSPVVTGMASSNATVEIRQGGQLIYTVSVAPGPFEFRDIPTYGSNGDLEITVIEADGSRKVRTQGFGMLPVMVREGGHRYQFSLGQLDSELLAPSEQWYVSTDGAYGFSSGLTFYGGLQGMQHYYAANAGVGIGTRFGSLSFDVTHSDSNTRLGHHKGESYRFRYGRVFHDVGTTLALAGYRYATEDYRSLNDHITDYSDKGISPYSSRVRSNMSVSVTQRLPSDWGSLSLSASEQDYWDQRPRSRSLSAGYGHHWAQLSYQLGVQRSRSDWGEDTQFSLYVSHPLTWGNGSHGLSMGSNVYQGQGRHSSTSNVGLSGSWDDMSYSLSANRDSAGYQSWSASTSLRSAFGEGGLGYSQGNGYQSVNGHWSGSLVAHAGGLNAAPTLYEGAILAEVPGIEGVGFQNSKAKTGRNGIAVLGNVTPYRRNEVMVDSKTLPSGVELVSGNAQVVPRRGAFIHTRLMAHKVHRVQFTLQDETGKPLPFGTQLESTDGTLLAIADPHGRALALLDQLQGEVVIAGPNGRSQVAYQVSEQQGENYSQIILRYQS